MGTLWRRQSTIDRWPLPDASRSSVLPFFDLVYIDTSRYLKLKEL